MPIENGTGLLIVVDESGSVPGFFAIRRSVSAVELLDPFVSFSATPQSPYMTCVYWDGQQMRIQNWTGSTRNYSYTWLGTSAG